MRRYVFLIIILALGLGLRFYGLSSRPLGFTWDEAALGYNAYSLLKTARDEHGALAPFVFKSFGDYKPGLYIYLTVPSIAVFGLNEFTTRLPSAIIGTLLIGVVFVFGRLGFGNYLGFRNSKLDIATSSALLMAINPWAIHFSRGAWEANLALFLTVLGATFLVSRKYIPAALFLGLTFVSYQGAKLFTPLVILSWLIAFRPKLEIKKVFFPCLLLLLLILPILVGFPSQSGRLKVFSAFSYHRDIFAISRILSQDGSGSPSWLFYLFHSEMLDQVRGITQRYLNHFSPLFLFVSGDWSNLRHSLVYHGYFYYPEILLLIIGLVGLIRTRSPSAKFLFSWLLLAPLPAALSRDIVSGVRSLPFLIPIVLILGIGLSRISKNILLLLFYFSTLLLFIFYFLDLYFLHSPYFSASAWLFPYKQAMSAVNFLKTEYSQVQFTDKLGQPYIFYLFYAQIDPARIQSQLSFRANPSGDVGSVPSIDNLVFKSVYWPQDQMQPSTLFVGDEFELPDGDLDLPGIIRFGDIYYPNGHPALKLVGRK